MEARSLANQPVTTGGVIQLPGGTLLKVAGIGAERAYAAAEMLIAEGAIALLSWGSGGAPVESGAQTSVFVATSESLKGISGSYFVHSHARRSSAISYDQKIQNRLWEISLEYSGL